MARSASALERRAELLSQPQSPLWPCLGTRDAWGRTDRVTLYVSFSSPAATGCRRQSCSLHLVEHSSERRLHAQCLLDLVGCRIWIFAVFQEACALVLAYKPDEGWTFVFQSAGKPSRLAKTVSIPYFRKSVTAS